MATAYLRPWFARAGRQTLLPVAVFLVRTGLPAGFVSIDDISHDEDSGAVDVPVEFNPSPQPPSSFTLEVDSNDHSLLPPSFVTVLSSAPRIAVAGRR